MPFLSTLSGLFDRFIFSLNHIWQGVQGVFYVASNVAGGLGTLVARLLK